MPRIPGINHQDAVRALQKAGFRVVRQGKHIVMSDGEVEPRQPQFLHGLEGPHPEQLLLEGADETLGPFVPLGSRPKVGLGAIPRNRSSAWKIGRGPLVAR